MRRGLGVFACAALLSAGSAEAANRTVCSSGCQYSTVQAAIDAAVPGDTILLRAGQTFTGNYILRNKNTTSTQFITIRSDAADSNFPAAGVRLIPEGKPGWNTRRSVLPRLVGFGSTWKSTPIFKTAAGAHHYRIQFVEIDGLANVGYETLIALGASVGQTSLSMVPHSIVIDRVWLHGHPIKGMKRGIYLNSASTDILNSYFEDFFSFADSQAICGTNGPGPFRIINNHLEAAGENILFGGADPHITNLVPSDITVRGNTFVKDLKWRNPILATPSKPTASTSSVASALSSGTHYFKVAAVIASGGGYGYSAGSAETAITITAGRSVVLSWPAIAGADKYRIYRGKSSNGQSVYMEAKGTTLTYTGHGELAGTPRTTGTQWTAKNLLELKNAQRVAIDGNTMEYNWAGFQFGFAILFSPRNQSGTAPWSVVRDIMFTNNTVRSVAGGIQILGRDYLHPSQQTRNLTIRNNVFENLSTAYGSKGVFVTISQAPANLVIDHNTIDHQSLVVEVMAGAVTGFVYTNNLSRHNLYGVKGQSTATGLATLTKFFPSAVFKGNVLAGGAASAYPAGNYFPPTSSFLTQFVSASTGDWTLNSSSTYNNRGTDGKDIGADINTLEVAQSVATITSAPAPPTTGGGTSTPTTPPPAPPPPSVNRLPTADAGGPYTALAGTAITVDGSGSTDPEAPLVRYDWHFGEDILLRAADVSAADIHGTRWRRVSATGAAGGIAIENPDLGDARTNTALANPASYLDITFDAASGVPYSVWVRMKASGNSVSRDSIHLQFDRAVDASGAAVHRIGTTASLPIRLEKCSAAGVSGWGWNDAGWCAPAAPVYFQTAGPQRIRIQQREDGVMFDQIVISSNVYSAKSPGLLKGDATLVPTTLGADTGIMAQHAWRRRGIYPLRIWVTDSVGQDSTTTTTVTVK